MYNGFVLGLYSGFGRDLIWDVDNMVEFIDISSYCMVKERFVDDFFLFSFPPNDKLWFIIGYFLSVATIRVGRFWLVSQVGLSSVPV